MAKYSSLQGAIDDVRYDDYDIEYLQGTRFSYLGNGRSRVESHSDAGLSFYIRNIDDNPSFGSKCVYEKFHIRYDPSDGS